MPKIDSIANVTPIDAARMRLTAGQSKPQAKANAAEGAVRAMPTSASEWIAGTRAAIDAIPRIDTAKVARIKAMLASGELAFDSERVANGILAHHGMLR
ncbi:flagellar biosynthesis anti-sigma factor FlgM [Pandoraea fibrosis]|uniref:Negative regulator of flagellin synthesis n=1 Tax=Pandoraea fibrosis TaxID=1891094 RepID=A0A5E4V4V7_9BURK|nr:flagellar biosynthesis anti-sigma factor FlgM [Pandoraea fibrosis]QHE91279.1 flagellar biosynthesis anti-sigma factor FlgM [Pandoraea fibrosis]QHF15164.1 flagellar biosynthesis anti-sigma factor FlgM [Pandoraea fibrosis]VVE05860.1 flagellar biosynthesis anti-sigma factor FlgM [Pandoraea fibrosis]